jgi:hypothetical protein
MGRPKFKRLFEKYDLQILPLQAFPRNPYLPEAKHPWHAASSQKLQK